MGLGGQSERRSPEWVATGYGHRVAAECGLVLVPAIDSSQGASHVTNLTRAGLCSVPFSGSPLLSR